MTNEELLHNAAVHSAQTGNDSTYTRLLQSIAESLLVIARIQAERLSSEHQTEAGASSK